MNYSKEHGYISGRDIAKRQNEHRPIVAMDAADVPQYQALRKVGIGFENKYLQDAAQVYAMDGADGVFGASIPSPVQFLQTWLPGFVNAAYAARKIDELVGISTIGNWHDESVVQGVLEQMGAAVQYGDVTNIPFADWSAAFEQRTVVRFEQGLKVGRLETARAAASRIDTAAEKRAACALALDIARNRVGFFGWNDGTSRTFGFLNDPALMPYNTVATGKAGATEWAKKSFLEITADLRNAFIQLGVQSNGVVDVKNSHTVLALPIGAAGYMSVTSEFGNSVAKWLNDTYPNCRIVEVPELTKANGGANVFYLFAESVNDSSGDDQRVWIQAVPSKFTALGVETNSKTVTEDFTNATAGVMLKRPYAVYRATGI